METFITSANRGSISTGYEIDNSLKLEADNSESLRTNSILVTPTNTKTGTFSFWVKRTELGANYLLVSGNSARYSRIFFNSDDQLQLYSGDSSWNSVQPITNAKFRDTLAWYHIVLRIDSNNGTAGDRLRLYVNSVEQTWATSPNITQNGGFTLLEAFASPGYHAWGANLAYYSANAFFSGYLAEVHYVDGQSLAPTEFGETDDNGIWIPKKYSDAHGNCGYYLDFTDSGNLGDNKASSGSTFDFNENNITAIDQATDTPTNNFAIANTLTGQGGFFVITEGATKGVLSTAGPGNNVGGVSLVSTLAPSSGKWYFEAQNTNSGDVYLYLGVADTGSIAYTDGYVFGGQNGTTPSIAWRGGGAYGSNQKVYSNNSAIGDSVAWETEVVGVALDLDNGKIYFHKSGTWINSGDPANGTDNGGQYDLPTAVDDQWYLGVSAYNLATWLLNFGGYTTMTISSAASDANGYGTFEYAPPSGYYALCTKNLAEYG